MFSELLVCSDCGGMLHFHFNQGNISLDRFNKMSHIYETEQSENDRKINELTEEIKNDAKQVDTTKMFLEIVEKTTHLDKLTADVVREFIDKIIVHHCKEENGATTQKVEIYYNVIGKVELPPVYNLEEFKTIAQAEKAIGDKIIA